MNGKRLGILALLMVWAAFCTGANAAGTEETRKTGEWYWELHPDGYAIITGNIYNSGDNSCRYKGDKEEPWFIPNEIEGYPVKELGDGALFIGDFPKKIVLPEGLTTIRSHAFYEGGIECIYIPSTVTTIEDAAFEKCSDLKRFELAEDNKDFQLIDGMLVFADGKELINCPAGLQLGKFAVPEGIEIIHSGAFSPAYMQELVFPKSLTAICQSAFYFQYVPMRVTIPSNVQIIDKYAFYSMYGEVTFDSFPQSISKNVFAAERVDFYFNFLPDVEMPIRFSSQEAMEHFFETGELEPSMLRPKPDPAPEQPVEDPPQDTPQIPSPPPKEEQAPPPQSTEATPPQDTAADHVPVGWYVLGTIALLSIGAGAYLTVRKGRKH